MDPGGSLQICSLMQQRYHNPDLILNSKPGRLEALETGTAGHLILVF